VQVPRDADGLAGLLAEGGFVAAEEEAGDLLARAAGDGALLDELVRRRLTGEPLAWITGRERFCGLEILIDEGVYVPRWQSEQLVLRALERLPEAGTAVDLCTGGGAIAAVLAHGRPGARVVGTEVDARALACAARNGVEVYAGDLLDPLPAALEGRVDLIVGVLPYVPTPELSLLQRDTFTFETPLAYDGGPDGTAILRRAIRDSRRFLRPGAALLLEVGGDQADRLRDELVASGYDEIVLLRDEEEDVRGIEATLRAPGRTPRTPSR
jgi:release factor glutamine methyltransferase